MGEEKPDEELMGKRKSSPRLSPTPLDAGNISLTRWLENIRWRGKNNGRRTKKSSNRRRCLLLQIVGLW